MLYTLRRDWERLDEAVEILSDVMYAYLDEDESLQLTTLLDKIELAIRDELSIRELARLGESINERS